MIRPATIAMLALAFGAIAVLFHVSYLVSELADELARVNREIERDGEETHVLRAEWSFLNRPDRLQVLTARYLDLVPLDPAQIVPVAAVPAMPVELIMLAGAVASADPQAEPAVVLAGRPKTKPRPPTVAVAATAPPVAQVPAVRRTPPQVAAVDAPSSARTLADILADLTPGEARR